MPLSGYMQWLSQKFVRPIGQLQEGRVSSHSHFLFESHLVSYATNIQTYIYIREKRIIIYIDVRYMSKEFYVIHNVLDIQGYLFTLLFLSNKMKLIFLYFKFNKNIMLFQIQKIYFFTHLPHFFLCISYTDLKEFNKILFLNFRHWFTETFRFINHRKIYITIVQQKIVIIGRLHH